MQKSYTKLLIFCLYLRGIKGCYSLYSRNRRCHSGNWNQEFNSVSSN